MISLNYVYFFIFSILLCYFYNTFFLTGQKYKFHHKHTIFMTKKIHCNRRYTNKVELNWIELPTSPTSPKMKKMAILHKNVLIFTTKARFYNYYFNMKKS